MKDRMLTYAIALGDDWFTGFGADRVLQGDSPRLLHEDQVKLAMIDLFKCGRTGVVYEVEVTKLSADAIRRRFGD